MKPHTIDINCDLGESYGQFKVGQDEAVFPYITSCNIACGFHGGDPVQMEKTIKSALEHQVQIGAHPSYPDLAGFGRRPMKIEKEELKSILKYQIAALIGITESLGGKVTYVKPHGALYNTAADDEGEALTIVQALSAFSTDLALLGMAGSVMESVAKREGIPFFAEAFADRKYDARARLLSRSQVGAVIEDPDTAAAQVLSLVLEQEVTCDQNHRVTIVADSICIHGDNPQAVAILQAIDQKLAENNITKSPFQKV